MLCLCTGIKKNRRRKQNGRHCSYRVDFIKEKPEKIELRSSFYVYGRILYNKNDIIPLVFATPLVFAEWQKMKKKSLHTSIKCRRFMKAKQKATVNRVKTCFLLYLMRLDVYGTHLNAKEMGLLYTNRCHLVFVYGCCLVLWWHKISINEWIH